MWEKIKFSEIAGVEKAVAEFNIWELNKCPYGKFKIKIFQNTKGLYTGYSNIQVIDKTGSFYGAVGHGNTEESALSDTIKHYLELVSWKDDWQESDFEWSEGTDF